MIIANNFMDAKITIPMINLRIKLRNQFFEMNLGINE
jgi:hypothetical protein